MTTEPEVRPLLNKNLIIGPEEYVNGGVMHYLKDRISGSYFRAGKKEVFLLGLCDGIRSFDEISAEYRATFNATLTFDAFNGALQAFRKSGLLEPAEGEKKAETPVSMRTAVAAPSAFQIKIVSWNPDAYLARIAPRWRWLVNSYFLMPWFVGVFIAELVLFAHARAIWQTSIGAPAATLPVRGVAFLAMAIVLLALHEFGHAISCKCLGGEVREMGFSLRYLVPSGYTKIDDIVFFPRWARLKVLLVGPLISLTVVPIALVVWLTTNPHALVHAFAADMLIWYNAISLLQLLPFVQTDGYFALAQILKMPELMKDSYMYLLSAILPSALGARKLVFKPECATYVKWTCIAYGALSALATAAVLLNALTSYRDALSRIIDGRVAAVLVSGAFVMLIVRFIRAFIKWSPAGR